MTKTLDNKLEQRNKDLERINEKLDEWHRVLTRAVNKINKLRKARETLLKPRKLKPFELEGVTGEEWHRIRTEAHGNFSDDIPDII